MDRSCFHSITPWETETLTNMVEAAHSSADEKIRVEDIIHDFCAEHFIDFTHDLSDELLQTSRETARQR